MLPATPEQFAKLFDHTMLKANATAAEIDKLCEEARAHGFFGVCVNPYYLPRAVKALRGSSVVPLTVVGFPLGAVPTATKVEETKWSVAQGAGEIDMVLGIGAYLNGEHAFVREDIAGVVKASGKVPVKVIIETAYLNPEQITQVSKWCAEAGAAFVKTSTGFAPRGASVDDIRTIKAALQSIPAGKGVKIKASGGIRDLTAVKALVEAGADRVGASASVTMLSELQGQLSL